MHYFKFYTRNLLAASAATLLACPELLAAPKPTELHNTQKSGLKIGIVNLNRLMVELPECAVLSSRLQCLFKKMQQEFERLAFDVQAKKEELEKEREVLAPEALEKLQAQLAVAEEKLNNFYAKVKPPEGLPPEIQALKKQQVAAVKAAIKRFSEQGQYDLILNDEICCFSNENVQDVTDEIVRAHHGLSEDTNASKKALSTPA